jgi:hypothetical protein
MLSLLVVLLDGKPIEVATVGREGVVGAMAGPLQILRAGRRSTAHGRNQQYPQASSAKLSA